MESLPVNWETLDNLVIDFAKSENLIEDSASSPSSSAFIPSSSPSSSSSYHSRLIIRQIRRSLESGDIDAAMDLLQIHAPSILLDHKILFRLQKQVNLPAFFAPREKKKIILLNPLLWRINRFMIGELSSVLHFFSRLFCTGQFCFCFLSALFFALLAS